MKNKTNLSFCSVWGLFLALLFLSFPVWSQTTVNFNYTGGAQTFTIPLGVTSISVDIKGAAGYGLQGFGGRVQATHPVTPGEDLTIYVGGMGTETTGGFNGGGEAGSNNGYGSGGGASDIRRSGAALANRIIVAGGGGGSGSNCGMFTAEGGHGGGLSGQSGCFWSCSDCQYTGGGGTQSAGGISGPTGHSFCGGNQNGSLGQGGSNTTLGYGTGGGGGYYGGGSGCFEGAGGGSSYTSTLATAVNHIQGFQSGNGQVTITYTGTPATGLHFDGTNDFVSLGGGLNTSTNFSTASSFTFEAWVKPDAVSGLRPVFGHRNSGGIVNGYCLSIGLVTPGTLAIEASDGTNASSTGTIPNNTWSHIAYVFNNGTITFYINGVAAGTSSGIVITPTNVSAILGTMSNGFGAYAGSMDEVRIWSRALSACEIQNNLNCELNPLGQTGLIALYQFSQGIINADNTAINTLTDDSGNGYTGTLANFALTGATSNWTNGNASGACTTVVVSGVVTNTNNGLSYCYIQDALDAADEGDEIMLLQNMDESDLVLSNSVILNAGAFTLTARNLTIPPTRYMRWLTNTLTIPATFSITNNGTLWNNGTIIHTDTYTNAGTYKGTGTFNGSFINNGTITPGD